MKRRLVVVSVLMLMIVGAVGLTPLNAQNGVINIYSARHYGAMEAPFVEFTIATGIEVRVSQGSPRALLERLRAEGDRTPADLFLAIDAGVLSLAAEEGLLAAVDSEVLEENIAPEFRDPNNYWFGLSIRARTIVYNPDNVTEDEIDSLNTYADLADPIWKGRLCMRPASHIYTVSLTSSLIFHYGEEEAAEIVDGWVANDPIFIDSDTRQIESVYAGECDVALVNHYYLGRLRDTGEEAGTMQLKWLNQPEPGTFFNINGAGVTANAENYDNAVLFLEWISSEAGQMGSPEGFPGSNYEYPVNPKAEPLPLIADFGEVVFDVTYPLWEFGGLQSAAVDLLEEAGYGFDES